MGKGKRILESLKRINESEVEDVLKKKNTIAFDNGVVLGVEYENGKLYAGSITNTGPMHEYEVDYDEDLSVDENLQCLYDIIINEHPEYLEESSKLQETTVYSNGSEVCINKKDSIERFIPTGMTADEVVKKFKAIMKHSVGRAWQWLKKVPRDKTIDENSKPTNEANTKLKKFGSWNKLYDYVNKKFGVTSLQVEISDEYEDEGLEGIHVYASVPSNNEYAFTKFMDKLSEWDYSDVSDGQFEAEGVATGWMLANFDSEAGVNESRHPRKKPTNEEYNQNTECPYTNILSDLANDENKTVEDYNKAIETFNGSDVPNKEAIIERLSHIRDEELEHVRELNEMHALLDGGNLPEDNPAESEDEFSLETEVVEESIETDSEVYKLLKGKEFDSYESIDKAFKDAGFEVTEVFREGDGFNVYATKDGAEYFIPFCACAGKYSAVIDTEQVNESKKAVKRTLKK